MFLHLRQGFSVVRHIVQEGLAISAAYAILELFESSRHLHLVIILEGLVELGQDHSKAIFGLGGLFNQVLDLSPGYAAEARHQVDGGFAALLVDLGLLLVQHDGLPPFPVVGRAIREDGDVGVFDKVHPIWSRRQSRGRSHTGGCSAKQRREELDVRKVADGVKVQKVRKAKVERFRDVGWM